MEVSRTEATEESLLDWSKLIPVASRALIGEALTPLGWLYSGAGALRRQAYGAGLIATHGVPVPVISVGSLAPGGSGKTPVTRLLATILAARGLEVGVVTSAYRGASRGTVGRVDLTAGTGSVPGAVRAFGDEAALLAGWLPRAVVVCGRDRVGAARRAVELGAQVVLVDDGFQHQRLERDLDLLMVDAPGELRGMLREPAATARLADLRWCHHRDGRRPVVSDAQVESRYLPRALLGWDGGEVGSPGDLDGRRVFVLAGVARPAAFETLARDLGARVVGHCLLGDHHCFSRRHLRRAARTRPDLILCTEKDAVRMAGDPLARDLVALVCGVEFTAGERRLERRLDQLF